MEYPMQNILNLQLGRTCTKRSNNMFRFRLSLRNHYTVFPFDKKLYQMQASTLNSISCFLRKVSFPVETMKISFWICKCWILLCQVANSWLRRRTIADARSYWYQLACIDRIRTHQPWLLTRGTWKTEPKLPLSILLLN